MDSAKETFAKSFTCPADRVEARVRKDVTASQVENLKVKPPPPEVAADPARLKLWQTEQSEREARTNSGQVIVEARGCNHSVLYSCGYANHHASTSSPWMCRKYDYPPGITKW